MPSFELNRTIVEKAERFGFDFALSMIKLHGFGGPSQFWDHNLESFTLMAGLAAVTSRIQLFATCAVLTMPPPIAARMAVTIDSIAPGRFGMNIISGWQRAEYAQMGLWPGPEHYRRRYEYCAEYVTIMKELWATGRSDFKGEFFQMDDCRCSPLPSRPIPIICAAQSDAGTRYAARHADYNFCNSFGVNKPTASADSVARLVAATQETGRDCGALLLTMIIADETDEAAMAKWNHYVAGTDHEALAWRDAQAKDDPSTDPMPSPTSARSRMARGCRPTRACPGRVVCVNRRDAGSGGGGAGRARRDDDIRRFRDRHGAVRHPHPAADEVPQRHRCRGLTSPPGPLVRLTIGRNHPWSNISTT